MTQPTWSRTNNGPIPTLAGDGSDLGRLTNITFSMQSQFTPQGTPTTYWTLTYHFSNSPGYQGGTQHIYVDLLDEKNNVIVSKVIGVQLHTEHCWYNGGQNFNEVGYVGFDFVNKGVANMNVYLDRRTGRIGLC